MHAAFKHPLIKFLYALSFAALLVLIPLTAQAAAVDIPCRPSETGANGLFTCVNQLYKYALVICSIAAVIMIMIGGYMYIFSGGNEKRVGTAKSFISSSLIGIAVLLVGFVLLRQINPSLLTIKNITPNQIAFEKWEIDGSIINTPWSGTTPGTTYTGGSPIKKGQWTELLNKIAQETNLDPCILQAILDKESSGGNPEAIGHDGGKTTSESFNKNAPPLYGLDWKHSHGIGMAQITIFPINRDSGWKDPSTPSRKLLNSWHTITDLLNPEHNVRLSAKFMRVLLQKHNGDLQRAYGEYNGGGVNSEYAKTIMRYYNTCKASSGN